MTAPQLTQYVQGQGSVSADGLNTFMQTTNIVSDLRNFVGVTGIEVAVRGQATVNDGGGGFFYWNATGVGPDDGVNTIVPFGAATGVWSRLAGAGAVSTSTVLLGGSGSYTTPAGARQLRIRMVGGGGGGKGAAVNNLSVNPASPGTATIFGPTTANPGLDGVDYSTRDGGGGGAGPALFRIRGGQGTGGALYAGPNPIQTQISGLTGGVSYFGGNGGGSVGSSGGNGSPNSGSGGAGGTYVDSGGGGQHMAWGGSGSAGEYVELVITGPAPNYPYTVGSGGAGGIGPAVNGGNGGSGIIIIEAFF